MTVHESLCASGRVGALAESSDTPEPSLRVEIPVSSADEVETDDGVHLRVGVTAEHGEVERHNLHIAKGARADMDFPGAK